MNKTGIVRVSPPVTCLADVTQPEPYDLEAIKNHSRLRINDVLVYTCPKEVCAVRPSVSGTWVLNSYSEEVNLMDIKGKSAMNIKMELESPIRNICISPTTGNLWMCCAVQQAIYEFKNISEALDSRFTLDSLPYSICVTHDENVLVGTELKVTLYTTEGQRLAQTSKDNEGKLHVIQPRNIAVCPRTGNIAICNRDWPAWGGNNLHNVVIMNPNLFLIYRLNGTMMPPSIEGASPTSTFDPYDTVFDSYGRLLIADHGNKCIQLVSRDGKFLTTIMTDQLEPKTLGLQRSEFLWIGFENCKIKAVKYTGIKDMEHL